MTIVQLESFDINTANPLQLLSTAGFWAALPRLTHDVGSPSARLLMIGDTLRLDDVQQGFEEVAVPVAELPAGVRSYRMQYEDFLRQTVNDVRFIRIYLVVDTGMEDGALIRMLSLYGISARELSAPVPRPFTSGEPKWGSVVDEFGGHWSLLRSNVQQGGGIYPRSLHNLFSLDIPVWAALDVYTYPLRDATSILRQKAIEARFAPNKTLETSQESADVLGAAMGLQRELNQSGATLHRVALHVLIGGESSRELKNRTEMARAAIPFEMTAVSSPGPQAARILSADLGKDREGSVITTPGLALLAGSALSYRRRTETRGVLLGVDRNQSPVIFNLFDDRSASYNMVVLGQTGAGKTFAVLLLMLRHLLLGCRLVILDPQGNIDLGFLGDVCQRIAIGSPEAAINIMDVFMPEIAGQVEAVTSMLAMLGVLDRDDFLAHAILDDVLTDIYEPLWGRPEYQGTMTLQHVQNRLNYRGMNAYEEEIRQRAALLGYKLAPYVQGSRAAIFGQPTSADFRLDHPVTVFDVSRLPNREQGGSLRSALLAILVANINQSIRRLRQEGDQAPILFFIDEMGILMRDAVLASHVSAEYKTARARLVGMIVADQDLHSLLGPEDEQGLQHGLPILANAANTLIFKQNDSQRETVRSHFPSLPDSLVETLPALAQGTCIAQFPEDTLLVNVLGSLFDRAVLSTRLQDRAYALEIVKRTLEEVYDAGFDNPNRSLPDGA